MNCFYHIINEIENNNNEMTVSEYFDRCIVEAINENEEEIEYDIESIEWWGEKNELW